MHKQTNKQVDDWMENINRELQLIFFNKEGKTIKPKTICSHISLSFYFLPNLAPFPDNYN